MITFFVIVCFVLAFTSGLHFALWDRVDDREGRHIYWAVGMALLFFWNIANLIHFVKG